MKKRRWTHAQRLLQAATCCGMRKKDTGVHRLQLFYVVQHVLMDTATSWCP
jgi:hypothetical protein